MTMELFQLQKAQRSLVPVDLFAVLLLAGLHSLPSLVPHYLQHSAGDLEWTAAGVVANVVAFAVAVEWVVAGGPADAAAVAVAAVVASRALPVVAVAAPVAAVVAGAVAVAGAGAVVAGAVAGAGAAGEETLQHQCCSSVASLANQRLVNRRWFPPETVLEP